MVDAWLFLNKLDDIALLLIAAVLFAILARWQLDKQNPFNLQSVVVDTTTGQASLFKIGQLFALIISSWIMVNETRAGRLTEWLFLGYMIAWSGANLANKMIDAKAKKDHDAAN
jgi:hypothetical protein